MHEMAICESIIGIIEEQASRNNYHKVKTVFLEIGKLAGVEIAALEFGFEVVAKNTIAEGARLDITEPAAAAWCLNCSRQVEVTNRYDSCPNCGSYQLQINGGDKLRIKELEVE